MLSKIASVALLVAVPGFLGYPAPLDVDPREKQASPWVEVEIWPLPPAPATTVVTLKPRWLITPTQTPNGQALDGDVLTRELQRQLRRVGCYSGEITGVWTQSSRRAMQTFTNRVNATLSVERPDHVLLAMLQNHPDKTCNKPCPLGENPAPDGLCVPAAIGRLPIKTAALPKSQSLITNWTAVETVALEDDIPRLPASKPSRPVIVVPVKPPPAPKLAAPPNPMPQRSMAANRERERDQPRLSQRAEREASRPARQSEFARTIFQRFDSSLR